MALYAEGGDSWAPAAGNKLYEREQLIARKMDDVRKIRAVYAHTHIHTHTFTLSHAHAHAHAHFHFTHTHIPTRIVTN